VLITGTALIVSTSLAYFNNEMPVPDSWKEAFEKMENEYNSNVEKIVSMKSVSDYIIALFVMGFIPALCEETLFRGGLQNFLSKGTGKPWLAIVVVSILFSLAHFSYYGFFVRVFLGIVLGAMFHYSGRLWLCVLAHFLNNALAMTILFDHMQKGKPISDALKSNPSTWWGILILPVVIGLFILFKRISVANRRAD
jgi:membrane protease YdiL (CAAX protease family)